MSALVLAVEGVERDGPFQAPLSRCLFLLARDRRSALLALEFMGECGDAHPLSVRFSCARPPAGYALVSGCLMWKAPGRSSSACCVSLHNIADTPRESRRHSRQTCSRRHDSRPWFLWLPFYERRPSCPPGAARRTSARRNPSQKRPALAPPGKLIRPQVNKARKHLRRRLRRP